MSDRKLSEETPGRMTDWAKRLLVYLLYAILLESVIESWVVDSEVKLWATGVVFIYGGFSVLLWKQIPDLTKAILSGIVILFLLASSSWMLGSASAEAGFSVLTLSNSMLAKIASTLAKWFKVWTVALRLSI